MQVMESVLAPQTEAEPTPAAPGPEPHLDVRREVRSATDAACQADRTRTAAPRPAGERRSGPGAHPTGEQKDGGHGTLAYLPSFLDSRPRNRNAMRSVRRWTSGGLWWKMRRGTKSRQRHCKRAWKGRRSLRNGIPPWKQRTMRLKNGTRRSSRDVTASRRRPKRPPWPWPPCKKKWLGSKRSLLVLCPRPVRASRAWRRCTPTSPRCATMRGPRRKRHSTSALLIQIACTQTREKARFREGQRQGVQAGRGPAGGVVPLRRHGAPALVRMLGPGQACAGGRAEGDYLVSGRRECRGTRVCLPSANVMHFSRSYG